MAFGWGLAALLAGLVLLGLVFLVAGVQLVRGRWSHVLAGASALPRRERDSDFVRQAGRVLGAMLAGIGVGVAGVGGWWAWKSYSPDADGPLLFAGVLLILVDLFTVWAFRAAREEAEREDA